MDTVGTGFSLSYEFSFLHIAELSYEYVSTMLQL
jgi:hypothetical protein